MLDQADDLRQLAMERARPKMVGTCRRPTRLTLVIDADPRGDDVAPRRGDAERLCRAADAVVVVTTCETSAVIGAFEVIKSLAAAPQALHLLVSKARSAREAESVRRRLGRACRRMLGIDLLGMDFSEQSGNFIWNR